MLGLTLISHLGFFRAGLEGQITVKQDLMIAALATLDFELEKFTLHFKTRYE